MFGLLDRVLGQHVVVLVNLWSDDGEIPGKWTSPRVYNLAAGRLLNLGAARLR